MQCHDVNYLLSFCMWLMDYLNLIWQGSEAFDQMASYGILPNMVLYLTREYGMEVAKASNVILLWSAATNFTPIVGAFLADSYVGRYPTIAFGSVVKLFVSRPTTFLYTTTRRVNCYSGCSKCESEVI